MRYTRYVLAVLFLMMAVGQIVSFGDFTVALETYRVGLIPVAGLGVAVIGTEIVAGAGLFAADGSRGRAIGATVSLAVALFWGAMAMQAFARGLVVPNCGCFGRFASQPLSWFVLVQDLSLVSSALWVYVVERGRAATTSPGAVAVSR